MEENVFQAGVRPGSPGSRTEIKMLICFILSRMKEPMSFEELYEALGEDALVNYFELVPAMEQLEESGHITRTTGEQQESLYAVTGLGRQAGVEFTVSLPPAVRERALRAADRQQRRKQRMSELSVESQPHPQGGYLLRLSIPESGGELVSFSLYVPDGEQRDLITKRFLNAPHFIYKGVLALLTGERQVLDEVFPEPGERLF